MAFCNGDPISEDQNLPKPQAACLSSTCIASSSFNRTQQDLAFSIWAETVGLTKTRICSDSDTLAEWLRRRPAKPMGSPCVGSNPTGVVVFFEGPGRQRGSSQISDTAHRTKKIALNFGASQWFAKGGWGVRTIETYSIGILFTLRRGPQLATLSL